MPVCIERKMGDQLDGPAGRNLLPDRRRYLQWRRWSSVKCQPGQCEEEMRVSEVLIGGAIVV